MSSSEQEEVEVDLELENDEDEKEIIQNGRELIKESNRIFQEIKEIEASKEFIQQGKMMVDTLIKRQEAKDLMEKGMSMLGHVRASKETQDVMQEAKDIIEFIKSEEKVQDIIEQCKSFIGQIKSKDGKDIEREQIENIFKQGSTVFQEFKENQQSSFHLERMKKMLFDLKEAESTRIAIMNGIQDAKKWVDSLKEKDPEYKNLIDQGEIIFNQLKNDQDLNNIVNDGKKMINDILSQDLSELGKEGSPASPEAIMSLIEKSGKVAETVKSTLKSNKLVEEYSQRQDVKDFLEKGNKFIHEVKSKEELIGFLKQNKDFIKEIKNTIVPFITDQLLKVQIPVVKGLSKGFNYEISNLVFAGLNIPPEGVNVDFGENNEITVSVADFKAQLKNFLWSYKQQGFPYLKDQGNASADCKDGYTSITFEILTKDDEEEEEEEDEKEDDNEDEEEEEEEKEEKEDALAVTTTTSTEVTEEIQRSPKKKSSSGPKIKITDITFKINQLEVIVEKGKALWLYNYLISKFSDSIRETVETKIKNTISTHVTTLTTKINDLVDQYWAKLIGKLKSNPSPLPTSPQALLPDASISTPVESNTNENK